MRYSTIPLRAAVPAVTVLTPLSHAAGVASLRPQQLAGLLTVLLAVTCVAAGTICVCICYALMRPERTRARSEILRAAPGKAFALGILASIVAGLYFGLVSSQPKAVSDWGWLLGLIAVGYLVLTGLCAVFHAMGDRLLGSLASEKANYDVWRIAAGGGLILFSNLVPILGQIVTAIAIVTSFGISVHHLLRKESAPRPGEKQPADR